MAAIRCPKCNLINLGKARICRRCKTRLPRITKGNALESKTPRFNRAICFWVVLVIAIAVVAGIFCFYKYSNVDSNAGTGLVAAQKELTKDTATNRDLEDMKQLYRDFITRLDQNLADHTDEGLNKNQSLALNTMAQLKELQNRYKDPAVLEYFHKFYRLASKYYDQLSQYISDRARMAEVSQRIRVERDLILNDSSLSPELRSSKLAALWNQKTNESKFTTIFTRDLDETVQSLRNLAASNKE
jgi:hypothetical protein